MERIGRKSSIISHIGKGIIMKIALNRKFIDWQNEEATEFDLDSRWGLPDGKLGWDQLLARRRVVILAEAGSGKSVEMTEQSRLQNMAGRFSFYATVEDVGADGLEDALSIPDRTQLAAWRTSNEPGWFFIDSVR